MMNKKRIIGLAFTYVGAVVGAGFSSGREIWRFFARHSGLGIYGIGIVMIFFIILAPLFFKLGKKCDIENYHCFFYKYLPKPFSYIFDFIYSCFLLGSVSVMLAGSGEVFYNLLGIPYLLGVTITVVFILLTLILSREGILTVNTILIPILTMITIYTVIKYISNPLELPIKDVLRDKPNLSNINWLKDSLLYGSYNLVMAIAVMTSIVYKEDDDNITSAGVLGGILLSILLIIIFIGITTAFPEGAKEEILLLYMAGKVGKGVYLLYIVALYFAMVTTAIANYYAFTKRFISLFKLKYELGLVIGLIFILPLVPSGFSSLIDKLYPLFGYLGILVISFYIILLIKKK